MKNSIKRIFSCFIAVLLFVSCPISVYAEDVPGWEGSLGLQLYYNKDKILQYIKDTGQFWLYGASQMGAIVKGDFVSYAENYKKMDDILATGKDIGVYVNESDEMKGLYFSKDFMTELKTLLDKYAKEENTKEENGGFYLLPTTNISDVPADKFINAQQFRTFRNIIVEKGCLAVRTNYGSSEIRFVDPFSDPDHPIMLVGNVNDLNIYKDYPYMPVTTSFFCANDWNIHSYRIKVFPENDKIYTSVADAVDYEYSNQYLNQAMVNWSFEKHGSIGEDYTLYSTTGEMVRVYVSQLAAKNYSVGNRKVYFSENYYNYVPEDLSVSIDDLNKTVDDLQKVIDELLKKINNDTSEKEIEELLKQILEELRKNPGTGEGGGGGDVNVDIDLSTTNSWLSKIYTKVSGIFDRMQSGGSGGTGGGGLQEGLDSILARLDDLGIMLKKYLSEITGDLDDIKGQLADMSEQEFNEKSDSFLDEIMDAFSEISEVVKTKFPFSILNDLRIFLSRIAPAQPEAEAALYLNDASGISLYSGEHGGGGISDGETDPPGGGGASRPGSGFIGVEHGGGGGSGDPVEMREAPVFRLPIVIERYGIEEYIIIDMAPFDPLSRFSRGFFTIIFMVCLFNLTFKVIGMWGDLIG